MSGAGLALLVAATLLGNAGSQPRAEPAAAREAYQRRQEVAVSSAPAPSEDAVTVGVAWRRALELGGFDPESPVPSRPRVILARPPQSLARRGGHVLGAYDPLTDTVVARDEYVLVHEFLHAILTKTRGPEAGRDEELVRRLMDDEGSRRSRSLYATVGTERAWPTRR